MRNDLEQQAIFIAPLMPAPASGLQRYVRLTRWVTLPLLVLLLVPLVWWWEALSSLWLGLLLIGIPANFLLLHLLIVRLLSRMEAANQIEARLELLPDAITIAPREGEIETFPIHQLTHLRWFYTGYEGVLWPRARSFNGSGNRLAFQFFDRKVEAQFRLVSVRHQREFLHLLTEWYAAGIEFEEYNQTSGLAVQSHLLKV